MRGEEPSAVMSPECSLNPQSSRGSPSPRPWYLSSGVTEQEPPGRSGAGAASWASASVLLSNRILANWRILGTWETLNHPLLPQVPSGEKSKVALRPQSVVSAATFQPPPHPAHQARLSPFPQSILEGTPGDTEGDVFCSQQHPSCAQPEAAHTGRPLLTWEVVCGEHLLDVTCDTVAQAGN